MNIKLTLDNINSMKPTEIIRNEAVKERFIDVYNKLWGNGVAAYERESIHFNSLLRDDEKKLKCTNFSIFTAFIDLAVCGLSLEPGAKALCYLQPRNYTTGKDANGYPIKEPRLTLTISGYGELVLRARCGQIQHADNPVLVYDEDEFVFSDEGQKQVKYVCHLPHVSNHIVACYIRITRADGSIDYGVLFEEDWLRLQDYSSKNNRYYDKQTQKYVENPNELYRSRDGQIDTGFLMAKCIKHAFKTYPKVKIGKATDFETNQIDEQPEEEMDYYNVQGEAPAMQQQPSFAPAPDPSAGVVVNPNVNGSEDDGTF